MNPYQIAIERSLDILKRRNFTMPLPASMGAILHDYVDSKVKVEVPAHISDQLFEKVHAEYTEKHKSYPLLFTQDLKENKTVINLHKGELIRCFLYNRQHVIEQLF